MTGQSNEITSLIVDDYAHTHRKSIEWGPGVTEKGKVRMMPSTRTTGSDPAGIFPWMASGKAVVRTTLPVMRNNVDFKAKRCPGLNANEWPAAVRRPNDAFAVGVMRVLLMPGYRVHNAPAHHYLRSRITNSDVSSEWCCTANDNTGFFVCKWGVHSKETHTVLHECAWLVIALVFCPSLPNRMVSNPSGRCPAKASERYPLHVATIC